MRCKQEMRNLQAVKVKKIRFGYFHFQCHLLKIPQLPELCGFVNVAGGPAAEAVHTRGVDTADEARATAS